MDLLTPVIEFFLHHTTTTTTAADGEEKKEESVNSSSSKVESQFGFLRSACAPRTLIDYFSTSPITSSNGSVDKKRTRANSTKPTPKSAEKQKNTKEVSVEDIWETFLPTPQTLYRPSQQQLLEAILYYSVHLLPPIADDCAFLLDQELLICMRRFHLNVSSYGIDDSWLRECHWLGIEPAQTMIPLVQALTGLLFAVSRVRTARMTYTPRVLRLAEMMHLTPVETKVLTYLLVAHCGTFLFYCLSSPLQLAVVAFQNHLTAKELLRFLAEDRLYIREGVLVVHLQAKVLNPQVSFNETKVVMPYEVVAALCGAKLSETQTIKLEKTVLSELLEEYEDGRGGDGSGDDEKDKEEEEGEDEREGEGGDTTKESPSPQKSTKKVKTEATPSTPVVESEMLSQLADEAVAGAVQEVTAQNEKVISEVMDSIGNNAFPMGPELNMALKDISPFSVKYGPSKNPSSGEMINVPYRNDVEFMEAAFKIIALIINIRNTEGSLKDEEDSYISKSKMESSVRELRGKVRVASAEHQSRLHATLKTGAFVPRIEQLSRRLKLTELEKSIVLLMVGNTVSHDVIIAINGKYAMRDGQRVMTVGYILFVLCEGLMERVVARKAFYRSAPLVKHSVLAVSNDGRTSFNTDLMDYFCDIDRKIVDSLMGMETETSELVPGSRLYAPTVPLSRVVLPQDTTALVHNTIEHYNLVEKCKKKCAMENNFVGVEEQGGLVIFFYGPSGTGKTMLANAVAHSLKKKILVVSVAEIKNSANAPSIMQFLFREAKLNDAIIFFDECETLFESREVNPTVTSILNAFERYDGVIVMATNQAQNLDEAMNRRISLMIEFKLPDRKMREHIWRQHIPTVLTVDDDVSVEKLALDYELSGGLIRNAVTAAIHNAVAREKTDSPTLKREDFEYGAKLQLRGFFQTTERLSRSGGAVSGISLTNLTPRRPLTHLVLQSNTKKAIQDIAQLTKSRNTLYSQWGFKEELYQHQYQLYLFYGPSGTGKSLAAEGIAYECGTVLRVCNIGELFLLSEPNQSINTLFAEARQLGAMVLLDEAQLLFSHNDKSHHLAQLLLYHAVSYPKPVIVIATTLPPHYHFDPYANALPFNDIIPFHVPDAALRLQLWQKAFPKEVPLSEEKRTEHFSQISKEYTLNAKQINSIAFNVCCKAANHSNHPRPTPSKGGEKTVSVEAESAPVITAEMIREEIETVLKKERHLHSSASGMFA